MSGSPLAGKVAIVTGGGRGLGRAYCHVLAAQGAAVVVNDPGVEPQGHDPDASVAATVAKEIEAAGGRAAASVDSVATATGGQAIVDVALNTFGRVDMFVHNAGIFRHSTFAEQSLADVEGMFAVHLMGAWHVGQPAWREMEKQGSGRIVLTTSLAAYGESHHPSYAAAKAGLIGLTKSLAHEARSKELDIKVNAVSPISAGRNARAVTLETWGDLIAPENVASVVAYLVSGECSISGEVLQAGGSHFGRMFLGQTRGWTSSSGVLTTEQVRDHLDEALALEGVRVPTDVRDGMAGVKLAVFGTDAI